MTESYIGIYNQLLNTVYANYLPRMRKEAEQDLFQFYDDLWRPHLQDIYPRSVATLSGGQVATLNDQVPVAFAADSQYMARKMDRGERTLPRGYGEDRMTMQGAMFKENGPTLDPFEFETETKPGLLARRNQTLVTNAIKAIERRIEFELVGYTKQTPALMNSYGNQLDKLGGRFKTFNTGGTPGNLAMPWDNAAADVIDDINFMNLHMNEMGEDIKMGFIGPATAYGIQKNAAIRDLIKYHFDLLAVPIATTIQGVTLKKVIGQTYKEDAVNANRIGYPGFGETRVDNYTTRRKIKMMVTSDKEWGIFVPGPIGQTYAVKTHSKQGNAMVPYGHTWDDNELEYKYSSLQFGMFPFIDDPAKLIVVEDMASCVVV